MRVLFTCHSTSSHWHPLVPIAQALERAGHEVAFASTPRFRHIIEGAGFRYLFAGPDETNEEWERRHAQMEGMSEQEETFFLLRNTFTGTRAEATLPHLLDIMTEWHPDLLVHENTEVAGCIAAEKAGIAHVGVQITAAWTYYLDAVYPSVARLATLVGLPVETQADVAGLLYRYLLLSPRPLSLWNSAVPIPPTTHAFKYESFSSSGKEGLSAWVEQLGQRPLVYATLGTFENRMTDILVAILEGIREQPVDLVLTVGRNRDPAEFGEQPPNVHVERYIPHDLILPYADMVLCHGGSGTVMDALSFGLPMVLLPVAADQPENAQRCVELGVARVVQWEEYAGAELARAIGEATREVLGNPGYREVAQSLRTEIEGLPGLDYVVAVLERLSVERAPVVGGQAGK